MCRQFATKNAANKAGYGNRYAKKAGFNKGGVLGNNVNYAFDKKFNRNAAETGGFILEENNKKHALDDFRNKYCSLPASLNFELYSLTPLSLIFLGMYAMAKYVPLSFKIVNVKL